ncbi:bifunctional riboflavin kinase/FAD synthetase [Sphingomonas sp. H39-1-10]|uniref:bifunctional riboflavin kinase/FAD synthetase n=1 Tax=Sphingomonas TaxID=13687 RepID=UPI000891596E|nr:MULTISPECIES: bifunctional riboflavin kinase/FAD synthetase [Sphingomonas]MDF0490870.1 bifunctional riboflavin kinase/FAD synthetase [Sphingomonas pollutisoli]SDA21915.1 riboflavin kinase / FMN adenylyltransferase [Sphingomonas sp. NFR15]
MERLDGSSVLPAALRGGIVALGNFDGFHLGHQAVVGRAIARARAEGRPALVATFDPHPVRYFKPDAAPFRLTTLDQRQRLFAEAGADAMIVFRFDAALAALGAQGFVEQRLIATIGLGGAVTGEDFTFGKARSGNIEVLADLGRHHGFSVEAVAPVTLDGEPVSSSRIRAALTSADPRGAARLLTRPFTIEGEVMHGAKLGRTIGFPTANLDMGKYLRPSYGIYAVRGRLPDGRVLNGAANLGVRPSFDPPKELLEPYFFDFSGDLYGQRIAVELIEFIRAEAKYDTLEALTAAIAADCDAARAVLARG